MSSIAIHPARPMRATRPARRTRAVRPTPAARSARPAPPALRLTRRGRAVLLMLLLAAACVAMVATGGLATATLGLGQPEPVRIVQVQPGDTLYDIAGRVSAPGEVRDMVQRIRDLNSLPGGSLQVGQRLAVPKG